MSEGNSEESERNEIQGFMKHETLKMGYEMGYVRAGEASTSGQEQRHDGMLKPLVEVICPFEQ